MTKIFKNGFTLSEVLITLGVIGVIAAITIPILVKNYQKMVFYTQFRKAATQIEQALKLYQVDHDCLGNISTCGEPDINGNLWFIDNVPNFVDDFAKYFHTVQLISNENSNRVCNYTKNPAKGGSYVNLCTNDIYGGNYYAFITNDGMLLNFGLDEGAGHGSIVDINGPNKGPNEFGRDIFIFYLVYGPEYPYSRTGIVWGGNPEHCIEACTSNINERQGCAYRLLQEGKMNY